MTFVDWVAPAEMTFWMNLFDVLILPSRAETWGCVILEAYASGVPVVGSDVGGIPEAMCGAGIIVPDGEYYEERFAYAVCSILDGRHKIDKQELLNIAMQHTWGLCVELEREVYESILNLNVDS